MQVDHKSVYDFLIKPIITEKSTFIGEQNKYIFQVAPFANKLTIKKSIESIFNVKVKSVNILNRKGKTKRFKGTIGRSSDMKKAIITLEKDYTIDFSTGGK